MITCIISIESNGILNVYTKDTKENIKNPVSLPYFNEDNRKEFYIKEPDYKLVRDKEIKIDLSYADSRVQPIKLDNTNVRRNDILF